MKLDPIITSLDETDQYKINMWQVFLHQFNKDKVVWAFKCRNPGVKFTPEMIAEIRAQIDHYCTLRFTEEQLKYLEINLPWLTEDFIDYLRGLASLLRRSFSVDMTLESVCLRMLSCSGQSIQI